MHSSAVAGVSSHTPGVLTRSATTCASPPVILADERSAASSYSYGGSGGGGNGNGSNNHSGWFSGLRAKIAQLSGMSEWLSQLGINQQQSQGGGGKKQRQATGRDAMSDSAMSSMLQTPSASTSASSSPSDGCGKSTTSKNVNNIGAATLPGEGYNDDTGFSFKSIRLDECAAEDPLSWLNWGSSHSSDCWDDTLERQHFGPLQDLLTVGAPKPGAGHEFGTINLMHPTWCDKCGDFIWGFMQQASKCSHCNYTCHERCLPLVTLDCRSASSSLSSNDDVTALYPVLDGGTLGTLPPAARAALRAASVPDAAASASASVALPEIPPSPEATPEREEVVKSAESTTTSQTNPLFGLRSASSTVPRSFAPSMSSSMEASAPPQQPLLVRELYVKEDTPFEFAPGYADAALAAAIDEYNREAEMEGLGMRLCDDGESFTGFLQIHMNFTRPINIVAGERPPTVYDVVNTGTTSCGQRTITSFFLPRNTVKTVAINSEMTARQMIVTLLRKFKVADNPRKFALYECTIEQECATLLRKLVRISDETCPLKRALLQWRSPHARCYVLQENDTGDILWDAFEVPELDNFLRILGMEEEQYKFQIQQKYRTYEYYLAAEIRARLNEPPEHFAPPPPIAADYRSDSPSSMIDNEDNDEFHTMRPCEYTTAKTTAVEPLYVNIQEMGRSTRL